MLRSSPVVMMLVELHCQSTPFLVAEGRKSADQAVAAAAAVAATNNKRTMNARVRRFIRPLFVSVKNCYYYYYLKEGEHVATEGSLAAPYE